MSRCCHFDVNFNLCHFTFITYHFIIIFLFMSFWWYFYIIFHQCPCDVISINTKLTMHKVFYECIAYFVFLLYMEKLSYSNLCTLRMLKKLIAEEQASTFLSYTLVRLVQSVWSRNKKEMQPLIHLQLVRAEMKVLLIWLSFLNADWWFYQ